MGTEMSSPTTETFKRAVLFFNRQRYAAAARTLASIVDVAPRNMAVRMLLARSYYFSAQLSRAEAELRDLLRAEPQDAHAHLLLGRTLERQGRLAEAAPHLRLADAMTAWDLVVV
ncbi:tetratricopeptide repeat protein [Actinacidiphila glaucinigra]|uniref:tetratricopeptide repeat protein n=1 Tax=Actinacidiphila glaucinigra TaxID=235986 RepID=UPI002DDB965C|nr:tetratricopeptide repeat protein [Actinacidiphila glaucinigra]WSD58389.1 tetratricopeptide repeat protein [Actinacidiphila glaucinigra]